MLLGLNTYLSESDLRWRLAGAHMRSTTIYSDPVETHKMYHGEGGIRTLVPAGIRRCGRDEIMEMIDFCSEIDSVH